MEAFVADKGQGRRTESMTWISPFLAGMSVFTTVADPEAVPTFTPSVAEIESVPPPAVLASDSLTTSAAATFPGTTWRRRISRSLSLFSGLRSSSTVPAGRYAKASSVGAKTVNGPFPLSVPTRSAAPSAAASVLNDPAATAVSTMSASGVDFDTGAEATDEAGAWTATEGAL